MGGWGEQEGLFQIPDPVAWDKGLWQKVKVVGGWLDYILAMKLTLFKAKQKEFNSNNYIQEKKKKDMLDQVLQIDKIQE